MSCSRVEGPHLGGLTLRGLSFESARVEMREDILLVKTHPEPIKGRGGQRARDLISLSSLSLPLTPSTHKPNHTGLPIPPQIRRQAIAKVNFPNSRGNQRQTWIQLAKGVIHWSHLFLQLPRVKSRVVRRLSSGWVLTRRLSFESACVEMREDSLLRLRWVQVTPAFRNHGSWFRIQGPGFRVSGLMFRIQVADVLKFGVWCSGLGCPRLIASTPGSIAPALKFGA